MNIGETPDQARENAELRHYTSKRFLEAGMYVDQFTTPMGEPRTTTALEKAIEKRDEACRKCARTGNKADLQALLRARIRVKDLEAR